MVNENSTMTLLLDDKHGKNTKKNNMRILCLKNTTINPFSGDTVVCTKQ